MRKFIATAGLLLACVAAAAPAAAAPDPWVQDQIDWANCIQAGHTAAECRQILDGPVVQPGPR
ncbi:hypothetical protein HLB23_07130 [Nocardia uniformis]|uniref:Uncharacterized protein n=1 Tax=Nocardia uniformis TaxID=53432 RepID=A0A849C9K7_9NOCA|nr:hypothetical protein [Nocardia uniformis]NNH69641.1 hypothetical protein [Nocardia uniformis]